MTRKEHFIFAWTGIIQLSKMLIALIIHSFAPRYFTHYYSDNLNELCDDR